MVHRGSGPRTEVEVHCSAGDETSPDYFRCRHMSRRHLVAALFATNRKRVEMPLGRDNLAPRTG